MPVLFLILLLLGAVCFLVAAFGATPHPRLNVLALGLFFWILVPLIQVFQGLAH
jgi:hypothetical protein